VFKILWGGGTLGRLLPVKPLRLPSRTYRGVISPCGGSLEGKGGLAFSREGQRGPLRFVAVTLGISPIEKR